MQRLSGATCPACRRQESGYISPDRQSTNTVDGQIAGHWQVVDRLGFMQQVRSVKV
jgi:hypothetical protein